MLLWLFLPKDDKLCSQTGLAMGILNLAIVIPQVIIPSALLISFPFFFLSNIKVIIIIFV
jgi:hypothetical protein